MKLKATVPVPVNPLPLHVDPDKLPADMPELGSKAGILTLDIPTLTDGDISKSFTDITPMTGIWNADTLIDAFNKAAGAFNERLHQELSR